MLLKRLHDHDKDGRPTKVRGVKVLRVAAVGTRHHFSPRLLVRGQADGWLAIDLDKRTLTIKGEDGELVYRILTGPGTYCCHCGKQQDGSPAARAHIEAEHKGDKSPDPNNPSGYRIDNHHTCERVK